MERYFIGAGALLEAGERSTITRANLHAQLKCEAPFDGAQGDNAAVLVDFDSGAPAGVRRLLAIAGGFTAGQFEAAVTRRLQTVGVCGIEDVAALLAEGAGTAEVHLFARWTPPAEMTASLAQRCIALHAHPLEEIARAALVAEHRFSVWSGPSRAA